jgi:Uma2 family endonuclease
VPDEHAYVPDMTAPLLTAEQLLHTHVPNKRTELLRGRLIVHEPPGGRHGNVIARLASRLERHTESTGAGTLFVGDTGFLLARDPDTVRGPDIALVRQDRLSGPIPNGYLELAPDLVVEVLSHNDRPGAALAKVGDWLDAGTRLIWVIDPERRIARIYRQNGTESLVSENDALEGEEVLPGFRCVLGSVL